MKRSTKILILICCAPPAAACLLLAYVLIPKNFNYVKQVEPLKGVHYRLTANYVYKGEPVSLDFGFTCSGLVTKYRDGDRSYDTYGGPKLYGNVMADGKALVVATKTFCNTFRHYEPNGHMPANFMPITIVYDDPETLEFGVAYMSDDAYENSSSVMKFLAMRIEPIGNAELEALIQTQKPNVVRNLGNIRYFVPLPPLEAAKRPPIGTDCYGWARYPLAEANKEEVTRLWPVERPKYWQPNEWRDVGPLSGRAGTGFNQNTISYETGAAGLPRRNGGGSGRNRSPGNPFDQRMLEWYPEEMVSRHTYDRESKFWNPNDFRFVIHAGDQSKRGFFYCTSATVALEERTPYRDNSHATYRKANYTVTVNGEVVANHSDSSRMQDGKIWVTDQEILIRLPFPVADGVGVQDDG